MQFFWIKYFFPEVAQIFLLPQIYTIFWNTDYTQSIIINNLIYFL